MSYRFETSSCSAPMRILLTRSAKRMSTIATVRRKKGVWVPPDIRDRIVDYMKYWTERSDIPCKDLLKWARLSTSKYHTWLKRYGKSNEHKNRIPHDWLLEDREKQAILDCHDMHPLDGYRRLTFMMLDDDIVAVSPSSSYRALKTAGRWDCKTVTPSKKGTGYIQPTKIPQEGHVDVSYINNGGTVYRLISVLNGYSRYIVHQELRETMKESDL